MAALGYVLFALPFAAILFLVFALKSRMKGKPLIPDKLEV